jgi:hypothetical protein
MSSELLMLSLNHVNTQQIQEIITYIKIENPITTETISSSSEYLAISVRCSIRKALIFFAYLEPYFVIVDKSFVALQMDTVDQFVFLLGVFNYEI